MSQIGFDLQYLQQKMTDKHCIPLLPLLPTFLYSQSTKPLKFYSTSLSTFSAPYACSELMVTEFVY